MTPEEIHQIGLEVARIEKQMTRIASKLGFKDLKPSTPRSKRTRSSSALAEEILRSTAVTSRR